MFRQRLARLNPYDPTEIPASVLKLQDANLPSCGIPDRKKACNCTGIRRRIWCYATGSAMTSAVSATWRLFLMPLIMCYYHPYIDIKTILMYDSPNGVPEPHMARRHGIRRASGTTLMAFSRKDRRVPSGL